MKRIPRLLLIAFALSLLVHLIVALIMRPPAATPQWGGHIHLPSQKGLARASPQPLGYGSRSGSMLEDS